MISCNSSLASSTPATSLKVTFFCCEEWRRARLLPKLRALLPPLCIWRIMKIQNPSKRTKGMALTRIETQLPPLSLSTLRITPLSSRRVVKSLYVGGTTEWNTSPFFILPSMSPVAELSLAESTLPALTSFTSSENCGVRPVVLLLRNANQTRTTRHRITSHRTAFLTLDEFMTSPDQRYT